MTRPVISVEHLRKTYGQTIAVADVSLEVQEGEIYGIVGPNGSGKTTTIECLQGLRRPDSGTIRVLALDPENETSQLRGRIGSQLQESALPERIKVWEALDLFASFGTTNARDWRSLLEKWGLAAKSEAYFSTLSGGEKQRLFIALALVTRPEIVFLDEMTAGLDPSARRVAWQLIEAVREAGTTVVIVTHFMDEAEHLCDRLAVIDKGRVAAVGTPQQLIARFAAEIRVSFSYAGDNVTWLEQTANVRRVIKRTGQVEIEGVEAVIVRVAAALAARGLAPVDFRVEQPSLEDVFLRITGGSE